MSPSYISSISADHGICTSISGKLMTIYNLRKTQLDLTIIISISNIDIIKTFIQTSLLKQL